MLLIMARHVHDVWQDGLLSSAIKPPLLWNAGALMVRQDSRGSSLSRLAPAKPGREERARCELVSKGKNDQQPALSVDERSIWRACCDELGIVIPAVQSPIAIWSCTFLRKARQRHPEKERDRDRDRALSLPCVVLQPSTIVSYVPN